jgi:hypothetical protein
MRHSSLVLLAVLAGAAAGCAHARPRECPCPPEATALWRVPCSWLQRIETPAEAAAAHTVRGVAFGEVHAEWVSLLSQMQPGDALWYYSGSRECPPGSKCFRPGEDGYLLLRGCSAVKRLSIAYTYTR